VSAAWPASAGPPPEAVAALVADRPGAVWLDGAGHGWSILAWDPVEVVTEARAWPARGQGLVRDVRGHGEHGAPFTGGVLGYVGYGAGAEVAPVPRSRDTPEPAVWLGRYEGGLCWRASDGLWVATGTLRCRAEGEALLAAARPLDPPPPPAGRVRPSDRRAYEDGVRAVRELLLAGDCYQVNLTRVVDVDGAGDAFDAFRRLRLHPAPYGAFVRVSGDTAVLSNSPELLLEVRGRHAVSVPIKGTRPRGSSPAEDAALGTALRDDPKDHAELTMIVDLVRNDLSRVAVPGSVRAGVRTLSSHPTVHHASWPVEATLSERFGTWDALAALFPPGSVTGAPKVRATERIAELEPRPRGVYCGVLGYAADGGDAAFSVAIRVAIVHGDRARYHVGGGIVVGSDPALEWEETVAKERALRAALVYS
jgi:para-aminobenzoate synthetase component 1